MEIAEKIAGLKKEVNAVILAHNYQPAEIQDIADFCGDSLELSLRAQKTQADVIVFCGVRFMAETAKIISPSKTVLIPRESAGCPLADKISVLDLRRLKKEYPKAVVLCYVNSSAEIKAESDYCCTSANAVGMVRHIGSGGKEIIFIPDKNLANYAKKASGYNNIIIWQGSCPVHQEKIKSEDVRKKKEEFPNALVLAHPECQQDVLDLADEVLSTSGMGKYVQRSSAEEFIIATEEGMVYRLQKDNPNKKFYSVSSSAVCEDMKKIDLNALVSSLEKQQYEIQLAPQIIQKASKSIYRMLQIH